MTAPVPVLAIKTPGDSYYCAVEAMRVAIKYMVPVILLSDGYIANGSEPWKLPRIEDLPDLRTEFRDPPLNLIGFDEDVHLATACRTSAASLRASARTAGSFRVSNLPSRIRIFPFTTVVRTSSPRVV